MKILLTGATGFIGQNLCIELQKSGHSLLVLCRNIEKAKKILPGPIEFIQWDSSKDIDPKHFNKVETIINLVGESVYKKRWTKSYKKQLEDSRIEPIKSIIKAIKSLDRKHQIKKIVSASAMGFYSIDPSKTVDENSPVGDHYFGELCQKWEDAWSELEDQIPVTKLRIGLVLGHGGGGLSQMIPLFQSKIGAILGNGKQWMNWIHIEDLTKVIIQSLSPEVLNGPVNAVSPQPVTNSVFSKKMAKILNQKIVFKAPSIAIKAAIGGFSKYLLTGSKVLPTQLINSNFQFKYLTLDHAFENILKEYKNLGSYLIQHQWFEEPKDRVFEFFKSTDGLEKITPKELDFKIEDVSPIPISDKTTIIASVKKFGIRLKFKIKIMDFDPPNRFSDDQYNFPFKFYSHQHIFEEFKSGTLMIDKINYKTSFGLLGFFAIRPIIKKNFEQMFDYRFNKIKEFIS